ncbi:hypothetical protein B0H13DRAFT_2309021 [Mycena leptocephala]|nr:hypothetical protein B0H13DRAFT_2309021 [Mycena leptocephala]
MDFESLSKFIWFTDTSTLSSSSATVYRTEQSALFQHAVPDLYFTPIGLCDPPNESEMELNGNFNTNPTDLDPHFFDEFLANLNSDPYTLMFSDSSNVSFSEEQSDDYNYLEYIGPPTDYDTRSAPSQWGVGNEFLQGMGSTGEGPIFHSTSLRLSQELPPLPAP